jgi:hypothetical protein
MGTVTGMSDEMPTGVDVRQADDAIATHSPGSGSRQCATMRRQRSGLERLVLAEYTAGRPHPAGLATARRTELAAERAVDPLRSLWPVVTWVRPGPTGR